VAASYVRFARVEKNRSRFRGGGADVAGGEEKRCGEAVDVDNRGPVTGERGGSG
jgi:hypothetical protein